MLPGLKTLLSPLSVRQFREQYWRQRHYVARARHSVLGELAKEFEDFDVYRLLDRQSGTVQAWFTTLEGAFRGTEIPKTAAYAAYDAGVTLYLPQNEAPAVAEWQLRLARELGHSQENPTCSIFAARRGAGTRCHFDTLENFTFQLRGTKRWRVLANRHVQAPLDNWVTGLEAPFEMDLYCDLPFPKDIPEEAETVELRPGDVLYLPRGYWHTAQASDDSVSLFLGFPATPCVDLVLNALRSHLLRHALWRQNFIEADADPYWETEARNQMTDLLHALKSEVAELSAKDVIGWASESAPINSDTVFRRNPIATIRVQSPHGKSTQEAQAVVVVHRGFYSREFSLPIKNRLAPLCRWIAQQKGSFPLAKVVARARSLPKDIVYDLLRRLCRCGFLQVCSDSA
jgi:50S ribosomal protein L16 3-hydroxylase